MSPWMKSSDAISFMERFPSRTAFLPALGLSFFLAWAVPHLIAVESIPSDITPEVVVSTREEPLVPGKFEPNWKSLSRYQPPDWFRDAKFGIWAHWGPQCQPEAGDWYARDMYLDGSRQNKHHLDHYGSPASYGFKEVIRDWHAENWDPKKLLALYQRAGARYFFALANHHDNFDLWDSKYQPWNAAAIGPKKDLIEGWAEAARANGMRFGVSVHAAHAWSWYEPAQRYDGKLTKADGKGQWWEGLDPQDLYAQNHTPSPGYTNGGSINGRWNWGGGVSRPDQAYCEKFYNRTMDLIRKYRPDLIYFDDTALPLWPVSDAGLDLAANFYNLNAGWHHGTNEAVLFGKILTPDQLSCMAWDIERGIPPRIEERPWQTDTCIGRWHYDRGIYEKGGYKSAQTVIRMLADIVSKNGNLLLNIPVRGDGTLDEKELAVVEGIGDWMELNGPAIYATRPWRIFGEGPASEGAALNAQGFNEGKGKAFAAEDLRFTVSKDGNTLNVIAFGKPSGPLIIKSLGNAAGLLDREIVSVEQTGAAKKPDWRRDEDALRITPLPGAPMPSDTPVFRITLR